MSAGEWYEVEWKDPFESNGWMPAGGFIGPRTRYRWLWQVRLALWRDKSWAERGRRIVRVRADGSREIVDA